MTPASADQRSSVWPLTGTYCCVVAVAAWARRRQLPPVEATFPEHSDKTSGDHLAWVAVLVTRLANQSEKELKGDES